MTRFPFGIKLQKTCLLCHDSSCSAVCADCLDDLAVSALDPSAVCPRCGGKGDGATACGACQKKPPPFEKLWSSVYYEPPVSGVLHAFKHQGVRNLAPVLAELMCRLQPSWLGDVPIDAVMAVPLSRERRWQRGFNQCDELAEHLAAAYGWETIPFDTVCRRHRPPQSTLVRKARRQNLKNSFYLAERQGWKQYFRRRFDVKNRNLLLIDDVCTTNATLEELARTLRRAGVARIFCWTLARAGMQKF
ncbi:MAG: ComF family protein [Neisseria sp.]|nr:ComF family protein [Neisseria sp.]